MRFMVLGEKRGQEKQKHNKAGGKEERTQAHLKEVGRSATHVADNGNDYSTKRNHGVDVNNFEKVTVWYVQPCIRSPTNMGTAGRYTKKSTDAS